MVAVDWLKGFVAFVGLRPPSSPLLVSVRRFSNSDAFSKTGMSRARRCLSRAMQVKEFLFVVCEENFEKIVSWSANLTEASSGLGGLAPMKVGWFLWFVLSVGQRSEVEAPKPLKPGVR